MGGVSYRGRQGTRRGRQCWKLMESLNSTGPKTDPTSPLYRTPNIAYLSSRAPHSHTHTDKEIPVNVLVKRITYWRLFWCDCKPDNTMRWTAEYDNLVTLDWPFDLFGQSSIDFMGGGKEQTFYLISLCLPLSLLCCKKNKGHIQHFTA